MTTAAARTNAVGNTISNIDAGMSDLFCKTSQFKVEHVCNKSSVFLDSNLFGRKSIVALGDILSHSTDFIQIIARHLFENGMNLRNEVSVYRHTDGGRHHWEIRTRKKRYMCKMNRVYSRGME